MTIYPAVPGEVLVIYLPICLVFVQGKVLPSSAVSALKRSCRAIKHKFKETKPEMNSNLILQASNLF